MRDVEVSRHERNGSLVLLDFEKIIDNPYLGVPAAFGLKEFINKIQSRVGGKTLIVIADMSVSKVESSFLLGIFGVGNSL